MYHQEVRSSSTGSSSAPAPAGVAPAHEVIAGCVPATEYTDGLGRDIYYMFERDRTLQSMNERRAAPLPRSRDRSLVRAPQPVRRTRGACPRSHQRRSAARAARAG